MKSVITPIRAILLALLSLTIACSLETGDIQEGQVYYLDPAAGSLAGDGTIDNPWPGLNEVIEAGYIRSHYYLNHPWDEHDPLALRNPDGPIQAGDTIRLLSGDYEEITLREMHFLIPLTIEGAQGHTPTATGINVIASSNINIIGVDVRPDPGYTEAYTLINISSHDWQGPSSHITIQDCNLYSVPDISSWDINQWNTLACSGISAGGDRIHIIGNTIRNVNFGITYSGNMGTVKKNTIQNFAGDGMRGIGNDLLFESNIVMDCYNVNENHDDGFQSWSLTQYDQPPRERVILRGNIIINRTDPDRPFQGGLQGIGCFDGFYIDWIVENNLILVDHWHGITFSGARGVIIRNNTVVDTSADTPGPSWIRVAAHKDGRPSENCLVQNNIAHSISMSESFGTARNNIEIDSLDEIYRLFSDPDNGDFSLAPDSPAIDAGTIEKRALADINERLRPKGGGVDIGAYESY